MKIIHWEYAGFVRLPVYMIIDMLEFVGLMRPIHVIVKVRLYCHYYTITELDYGPEDGPTYKWSKMFFEQIIK
jgi:hypothetical protein